MNSGKLIGYISQIHKDLYPEYIENSCKLGKKKKKKTQKAYKRLTQMSH